MNFYDLKEGDSVYVFDKDANRMRHCKVSHKYKRSRGHSNFQYDCLAIVEGDPKEPLFIGKLDSESQDFNSKKFEYLRSIYSTNDDLRNYRIFEPNEFCAYVQILLNEDFNVKVSNRMERTNGQFKVNIATGEETFTFSHHLLKGIYTLEAVNQIILHEYAHYLQYKRNGTLDHGSIFNEICSEIGCTFNKPKERMSNYLSNNPNRKEHLIWINCPNCGYEANSYKRLTAFRNPQKYACPDCGKPLKSGRWGKNA